MIYKVESDNCPGCRKMQGMLDAFNIEVEHINIGTEAGRKFAQEHGVSTLPSLVKIENGKAETLLGLKSKQEILNFVNIG